MRKIKKGGELETWYVDHSDRVDLVTIMVIHYPIRDLKELLSP